MKPRSMLLTAMICGLALAGCVRPPAPLAGRFEGVTVQNARAQQAAGTRVRWGGAIVETRPDDEESCFEIVSHPLDASARPREVDESDGRFLACAAGFYDPMVYAAGREITVVGAFTGNIEGRIGERDYLFPRVAAEHVYLWPKREPTVIYQPVYQPPLWYPSPYWSPYYRRW